MTIYKGGNIYEFMWKDFQNFQGHWEVLHKVEHNRIAGTIKSLMQEYEKWRMREYQKYNKREIEMELERIKKRIDESIKLAQTKLMRDRGCTLEMAGVVNETITALQVYKEFIYAMEKVNNPVYDWSIIIRRLEETYYPQPKTFRQKIMDIANTDYDGSISTMRGKLLKALEDVS